MSGDDPWDWSTDRVVKELCTADRSWQPQGSLTGLPTSIDLDSRIRDEGIDGGILLCDVTDEFMKQSLGLTKLGWRSFVLRAIEQLRARSAKYNHRLVTYIHPSLSIPHLLQQSHIPPTPPTLPQYLPHINNPIADASRIGSLGAQGLLTPIDGRAASGEFLVSDEFGNKRRRLDLTNANISALQNEDSLFATQPEDAEPPSVEVTTPSPLPELVEINGKKRKRIAPTLVSALIDPNVNRAIPTAADDVVLNNPDNIEPGVVFRDPRGKKRVVPILQPDGVSENLALEEALQNVENKAKKPNQSRAVGYLGNRKMAVDDIFYTATSFGQDLPGEDYDGTLDIAPQKVSSGCRLYMHRIMKRFLNSKPTVIVRGGETFSAVQPYRSRIIATHHTPSFTLFYAAEDGEIHSRREALQSWPEIDPEARREIKTDADGNPITVYSSKPEGLAAIGSFHTFDPELLVKWNDIVGGDRVLPLYGESGSENEFDPELLKEMEREQGTLEKPHRALSKALLTIEEVNKAIDDSIDEMVSKWREHKLPAQEQKAFGFWKKYRSTLQRKEKLNTLQLGVEHLDERLATLRKEIAEQPWLSREKLRAQTRCLERTIYDREERLWKTQVLESKQQPEKLAPQKALSTTSSKRSLLDDSEDGESLDSHSDASISGDGLADFIVDDSPVFGKEKELSLLDQEDEDGDDRMSDVSVPNLSARRPTARKLFTSLSSELARPGSDDSDDEPMQDLPENDASDLPTASEIPSHVKHEGSSLPKSLHTSSSRARSSTMVDLTKTSDDENQHTNEQNELSTGQEDSAIDLITPVKKKITTAIRLINRNSPIVISDSDDATHSPDRSNLPALTDTAAIASYRPKDWAQLLDRERLMISVLHVLPVPRRNSLFALTAGDQDNLWHNMREVMRMIRHGGKSVKGMDQATFDNFCRLIRLFMVFADCKYYELERKPNKVNVSDIRHQAEKFPGFHSFCHKIEGYFNSKVFTSTNSTPQKPDDDEDEEPHTGRRSRSRAVNASDDEQPEEDTPHKTKRKKKIFENTEARQLREQDHERRAAQEERRNNLLASQANFGDLNDSQVIINLSKLETEGFVYVNQKISRKIKSHQIDGVRFLWDQVVSDGAKQGCLLAHTMGLGKTMQVITLLVAIAEGASSSDESVNSQIPQSLRESKTLILCPPTLIDNWMDELLIWAPTDSLGSLRKVDSTIKNINHRWEVINNWYNDSGVLILGYEMFRGIIDNKKKANQDVASIDEEQHARLVMQLTEGPNIIIADEAHKLKNAKSALTLTTSLFRSRSRIALTGSPLANNVEEYHTMIEWVAPNYLGPAEEFRAKYVEPIQAGLYHDSTPYERRKSLTMLGVLKEDLSPKVHRADMSVLRKDLPPKTEFVITVPLTGLQRKAYSAYVNSMLSSNFDRTKDGDLHQTTIWSYLAILSLLCNHPDPFMNKLNERTSGANRGSTPRLGEAATDHENIAVDLNPSASKVGVSNALIDQEREIFAGLTDIKSIDLSYKTKILCQILDASKAVGDKALVFSASIPTLDFLEKMCQNQGRKYARLDGTTPMGSRQSLTKKFNTGNLELYLISTAAGGLGLNLYGANRVVIFDFKFNPILEEQAVGRAYRIGQKKDVFVYRFVAGGTFEDSIHNTAVFKKQLAARVVDKRNPIAWAKKKSGDFLFEPKDIEQQDLSGFRGMDPFVLDKILALQEKTSTIRGIVQTDTFEKDDDADNLTPEEMAQVKQILKDEKHKRMNPQAISGSMPNDRDNIQRSGPLLPPPRADISRPPSKIRTPAREASPAAVLDSKMFAAMNKQPVQSLRTPVTKSKRAPAVSPHALEDAQYMKRVHENRKKRTKD